MAMPAPEKNAFASATVFDEVHTTSVAPGTYVTRTLPPDWGSKNPENWVAGIQPVGGSSDTPVPAIS